MANHGVSPSDSLCCCEYAREGDGQIRNVFQCFCECEDLDRLADDFIRDCCGAMLGPVNNVANGRALRRERLLKLCETAADRTRIPWLGGARRVNAGFVAAFVELSLLRELCNRFPSVIVVALLLLLTFAQLFWMHVLCLSLPLRTDFFAAWIGISVVGIYVSDYISLLLPTLTWPAAVLHHILLAVVLTTFVCAYMFSPLEPPATREESHRLNAIGKHSEEAAEEVAVDDVLLDGASSATDGNSTFADFGTRGGGGGGGGGGGCDLQGHSSFYPCRICSKHVLKRDHHCVWLNQCVGAHNHRVFVLFLFSFTLMTLWFAIRICIFSATSAGVSVSEHLWHLVLVIGSVPTPIATACYALGGGLFTAALLCTQIINIGRGLTEHELKRARHSSSLALDRMPTGNCLQNWSQWVRLGSLAS